MDDNMYYEKISENPPGFPQIGVLHIVVSANENPTEAILYKYTVRKKLTGEEMMEAAEWADHDCTNKWLIGCNISGFDDADDAAHFKLIWK